MPYIIPEAAQKAAWDAYFKQDWELPHLLNAQLQETQADLFDED